MLDGTASHAGSSNEAVNEVIGVKAAQQLAAE